MKFHDVKYGKLAAGVSLTFGLAASVSERKVELHDPFKELIQLQRPFQSNAEILNSLGSVIRDSLFLTDDLGFDKKIEDEILRDLEEKRRQSVEDEKLQKFRT